MLHAVIMAGGSGTRFWPASRRDLPKQFLTLSGDRSLLQQATDRCLPLIKHDQLWIVTGARHAVETGRQLPALPSEHVLIEPCGRNTAPCIGLAAIRVRAADPDAVLLVTPADHVISPTSAFVAAVERAVATVNAAPEKLCLFGIVPNRPATGYGYIERGGPLTGAPDGVFSVVRFREKPDLATAQQFLAAGNFLWNSGIFVWRADTIIRALQQYQPELHRKLEELSQHCGRDSWHSALERDFPSMPSISIDYAVLEHSRDVCVIEAPFGWDDVGSWAALLRLHQPDADGNIVVGKHCGIGTRNCTIYGNGEHLITTIGLDGCTVVHTPTATLVAKLDDEAQLKDLLKQLEQRGFDGVL